MAPISKRNSAFLTISLLILSFHYGQSFIQQFTMFELHTEFQNISDAAIVHHTNHNTTCIFSYPRSACRVGMWSNKRQDGATDNYSFEFHCSILGGVGPVIALRRLGALDTDTPSLTLYEEPLNTRSPVFGPEHYFEDASWSGTIFPTRALALTGYSNWTVFENPNFVSPAWCIRSTRPYQYVIAFDNSTNYPQRVGSVLRDCFNDVDKIIYVQ